MSLPKCFLCRCEDVTVEEFREAYREGFTEFESLKRYTGVGTGFCQGKGCLSEAALELARLRGVPAAAIPLTTIRQPAEPQTFATLARLPVPAPFVASLQTSTDPASESDKDKRRLPPSTDCPGDKGRAALPPSEEEEP